MTLRIGTRLVGIRADTDATLTRLRTLLRPWVDDTHPDVPWVFDVRLDPLGGHHSGDGMVGHQEVDRTTSRGPWPVPQLRVGQVLMSRSRNGDDVLRALASVLGGVLERQDDTRVWLGMRTFVGDDRIVLVDAQPPALSADPALAAAGVAELPTWSVAIDEQKIRVPAPLGVLAWDEAGLEPPPLEERQAELAGIVALDRHHHGDAGHEHAQYSPATALSRFGIRHPSTSWFATVEQLVRDGRVTVSSDRSTVRRRIIELAT